MVMIFWLTPNLNRKSFFSEIDCMFVSTYEIFSCHNTCISVFKDTTSVTRCLVLYVRCTGQCKELACFRHKYGRTAKVQAWRFPSDLRNVSKEWHFLHLLPKFQDLDLDTFIPHIYFDVVVLFNSTIQQRIKTNIFLMRKNRIYFWFIETVSINVGLDNHLIFLISCRWLIEVNASPSLTASSQSDYELKCRLLEDMLHIVDMENRCQIPSFFFFFFIQYMSLSFQDMLALVSFFFLIKGGWGDAVSQVVQLWATLSETFHALLMVIN